VALWPDRKEDQERVAWAERKSRLPWVLSASRRTDMVGCFPQVLADRLRTFRPEEVHSVVLWTKTPQNIRAEGSLKEILSQFKQIYLHLTITGMGGGEFEPMIPPWQKTVEQIPSLIAFVKSAARITWRFDPILTVSGRGKKFSNFDLFPILINRIAPLGIPSCRVSWVSPYAKVLRRLAGQGWELVAEGKEERAEQRKKLEEEAKRYGMALHFCAMEGFPVSRCIDGGLLSRLHPDGRKCSQAKAKGQRAHCGCTESLDIGWYSLRCAHRCLYCYACP
jgi:hypothetical protein